jgi:hypothetical protein
MLAGVVAQVREHETTELAPAEPIGGPGFCDSLGGTGLSFELGGRRR